jgi:hypothetical protein
MRSSIIMFLTVGMCGSIIMFRRNGPNSLSKHHNYLTSALIRWGLKRDRRLYEQRLWAAQVSRGVAPVCVSLVCLYEQRLWAAQVCLCGSVFGA